MSERQREKGHRWGREIDRSEKVIRQVEVVLRMKRMKRGVRAGGRTTRWETGERVERERERATLVAERRGRSGGGEEYALTNRRANFYELGVRARR